MAKEKARIKRILKRVENIWKKYPDLRLMQMLVNVLDTPAPYYVSDEELEKELEKAYK